MSEAIVIGRIGRPHGVRGSVRARPSGRTLAELAIGESVEVRPAGGPPRTLVLAARAGTPDGPILTFDGVASREDAAALTGAEIAVALERVPEIDDPDTFLVRDLVGCAVLLGDRLLGEVREVIGGPANDVLEVTGTDGAPVLIPFTADALLDLDVPGRRIVVRPDLLGADPDPDPEPR
ncbi:MAG TPA: ribosome maturation factor RimM [Miltoncostaea sp.]|nr:ribosome maturation factor RimM [Miltoncostaea sp.]